MANTSLSVLSAAEALVISPVSSLLAERGGRSRERGLAVSFLSLSFILSVVSLDSN